jgi:AcrR family transcriptional regulator
VTEESKKAKIAILETAGKIFVEKGYRAATIRQICAQAGVNVAAVNYYFGNKKKLYASVLNFYKDAAYKKYPLTYGIRENDSARSKIASFIHAMMMRIFEEGYTPWFGKLLLRELIEPTGELDALIKTHFRPSFLQLASYVRNVLGPSAAQTDVFLCAMSIFGQCLYFCNSPSVTRQLVKKKKLSRREIDMFTEHITRFSLAALDRYRSNPPKVKRT